VAPHYYYPGWWEGSAMLHNFINLEKWNSLPKAYQSVIRTAADMSYTWMQAKYDALNPPALKRLIAAGTKLHAFPPVVMDASYKAANELYAETTAANPDFKKVYDAMVAFRGDQYLWWQVAEYSFDTFQIRARTRT
jgi:TRAP-type mannitol/chloroaromatic compound transport system substrate-binding protein